MKFINEEANLKKKNIYIYIYIYINKNQKMRERERDAFDGGDKKTKMQL